MKNSDIGIFDVTLTAIDIEYRTPPASIYVHFMDLDSRIRYGFWNEQFQQFYCLEGRFPKSEIMVWYEVPKFLRVAKR